MPAACGDRGATAPGEEIERDAQRGFRRIAERVGEVVARRAGRGDAAGKPGVVIALMIGVFGAEGDHPQAVVAGGLVERDLADRLAIGVGADQPVVGAQIGLERVDQQLARRCSAAGADERDLHRRDRLRLRREQLGGIVVRFLGAEGGVAEHLPAAVAAEQVAEQFGNRDQPAAVVAQIDHDLADPLRAEPGECGTQRRIGGIDERAQVDVADLGSPVVEDLRTVARRNRSDLVRALGHGKVLGDPAGDHAQDFGDARRARSERRRDPGRTFGGEDRGHGPQSRRAVADGDDLGPAVDTGGKRGSAFVSLDHEEPGVDRVVAQADAEPGAGARGVKRVLLRDRGQIGEIAVLRLRPRRRGQGIEIGTGVGVGRRVDRSVEQIGEQVPLLHLRQDPVLALTDRAASRRSGGGRGWGWGGRCAPAARRRIASAAPGERGNQGEQDGKLAVAHGEPSNGKALDKQALALARQTP